MGFSGIGGGAIEGGSSGGPGPGPGPGVELSDVDEARRTEEITLTLTMITNRQVTLAKPVDSPSETQIGVVDGLSTFDYGVDFTVSGTTLSWAGLGLEPLVEVGDILKVYYFTTSP